MLFKFCGTVSRWKYPGAPCRPRWCPGVAAGVLAAWPFGRDAEGLATAAQRREAGARRTKCRWFPAKKWEQCSKAVRSIQWLGYLRIFGIQSSYSFFPISWSTAFIWPCVFMHIGGVGWGGVGGGMC